MKNLPSRVGLPIQPTQTYGLVQKIIWIQPWCMLRIIGSESTLANLGNDPGFISKWYISIGMRSSGKLKAKPWELMLKVNNIISLWRVVIPNMISEPCPKLSHVNRIFKYRTKNCEPRWCSQKWLKCRTKGHLHWYETFWGSPEQSHESSD